MIKKYCEFFSVEFWFGWFRWKGKDDTIIIKSKVEGDSHFFWFVVQRFDLVVE